MSSFASVSVLCLLFSSLLLLLLLKPTTVHGDDPLFHFCQSTNKSKTLPPIKDPKTYQANLRKLLARLPGEASHMGFAKISEGTGNDAAYGLALCRGDVQSDACAYCVGNAAKEIQSLCVNNVSSIIWYDFCEVRYSPENFFGKIDTENIFEMVNYFNLTNKQGFVNTTTQFLLDLSKQAASNANKFYAAEEEELCEFLKLRGLVQCTRDLSATNCAKCLRDAVDELSDCCSLRQGARVVGGSCNVRYEIYPFFSPSR